MRMENCCTYKYSLIQKIFMLLRIIYLITYLMKNMIYKETDRLTIRDWEKDDIYLIQRLYQTPSL